MKIDTAITGRFAFEHWKLRDSTLESFKQPSTVILTRPGEVHNPEVTNEVLERFDKSMVDIPMLMDTFSGYSKKFVDDLVSNLSQEELAAGLLSVCEEYSSYTIFRYAPTTLHLQDLEAAVKDLRYRAKTVKNMPNAFMVPFNENIFNFTRKKFIERHKTSNDDLLHPEITRPNWEASFSHPSDVYYLQWLLVSETIVDLTVDNILAVTKEEFIAAFDNTDIDMCEEAIRQALMLYHGREPIPEEPMNQIPTSLL